ncbi:MAG TPA: hypothetical protein VGH74_04390 [Planctomycetaceae bacterium]|jgi:hypothetical protein
MLALQSSNALNDLPLRAQLAFAARCARRVINRFRLQTNHPDLALCCKSLGAAIRLAESFAAGDEVDADDLAAAEEGTLRAVVASSEMRPANDAAAYAANATYAALCAVKAALEIQDGQSPGAQADRVAEAVMIARDAAVAADDNVARPARLDAELLNQTSLGHFPDFGEPVDCGETGILGPLFQDFSRGMGSEAQSAMGGAAGRNKLNSAAAGGARIGQPAELGGNPASGARAGQSAEIDGLRKQIEADRRRFQTDRAAFDAEKQALQLQLFQELAKLDHERQSLQNDQNRMVREFQTTESHETELASRHTALEAREQELVARSTAVEAREHELQARHSELESREDGVASHLADLEIREIQLEAEKNATRAAFESLREERREFLEQRLRWMTASMRS